MISKNSKQHHYQNYFQQTFKSNDSNFKIENKTVLNLKMITGKTVFSNK